MKILEMRLIAYGPFTDVTLDLSAGNKGLHVIYGPNEAGKSSALRAVRHLLYGIPGRSSDDFLHPYAKMRIGATIQTGSGDPLEFIRRKGRSNTLRAADDQTVIEDATLNQFLNGVDADFFETMFGIGYPDLVRGGQEIVQGGGNLGQLIFAIGSGVANLREIQNELQSEADALFRPSGQRPKINEALGLINKNRKEMREVELPGQEWENHYQTLQQAEDRIKYVESDLKKYQRKGHCLERTQDALPIIAKRKVLIEKHKEYITAIILPEEFAEQRRELLTKIDVSKNEQNQSLQNIEAIKKAIAGLQTSARILESSELIEAVYQDLGTQRKATKDRIKLETLKVNLRGEATEILRSLREDLTVDDVEQLRIKKTEAVRIQEFGSEYERITTRIETSREVIPKLTQRIKSLDEQLKKMGAPKQIEDLKIAIEQTEEFVADEKHCRAELSNIQISLKSLEMKLNKQTLWAGSVEELEALPVPQPETIRMFEKRHSDANLNCRRIKEACDKLSQTLVDLERQIEELRLQQEVPTEEDLQKMRAVRDRGWQLVADQLKGKESTDGKIDAYIAEVPPSVTLAEAFQFSLLKSDDIADRLRREADRVATKAKLIADRTAFEKQLNYLKAELNEVEKVKADLDKKWLDLWRPSRINPRSPKEMQAWTQNHDNMADKAAEIREKMAKAGAMKTEIDMQINTLDQILLKISDLPDPGHKTLSDLVKRARKINEKEEKRCRKQEQLENEKYQQGQELSDAKLKVKSSEKDLSQWQKDWEKAVRPLGLDADAIPPQANAVMNELKELFGKLKEANILKKRIEGIDRDAKQFGKRIISLAKTVAKDLSNLPVEEATIELNQRLTRARTAESKRQTLQDQLNGEKSRLERSVHTITKNEILLNGMCKEAGCLNYDDLPKAEKRSDKRLQIEADLLNLDERLLNLSGGSTIDDFIKESLNMDPDGIDGDIELLNEEIEKLNREKSNLNQTIGEERNELSKMDGSARAAEMAEDIQILMGGIENDIEQYARLKIASKVLNQAIERYRDKSQGPILNRASALFHQITGGSFEGVRAEFDGNGKPTLVGVRAIGKEIVPVDGMSDGTSDQLYLSLRLAGLEEYLDKNEPIPFIVDDILIKFDDARATATLQILAKLSSKTQVIFFTHHRHLIELAEKNIDSSVLIKHHLYA